MDKADAVTSARKLWLSSTSQQDLSEVERLYRWALSSQTSSQHSGQDHDDDDDDDDTKKVEDGPLKKKIKSGHCGLSRHEFNQAGEKLALLLCQSGRCKKAKRGLTSMGFTCRLAERVLDYPSDGSGDDNNTIKHATADDNTTTSTKKKRSICQIVDGFLSQSELERLRLVFESPTANYWLSNNYTVEPPSPYFSWVISLEEITKSATDNNDDEKGTNQSYGFIGDLIQKIISCPMINDKFPQLQAKANFVEIWAHNRPHASGHQMHFDSDDEGRGGVRNPIISTILYITASAAVGGPSLVTNQKLTDIRLATKGYLAHPKPQRLVAFDGKYLHGVIPGKGFQEGRRTTIMLAFWDEIQIRRGSSGPGSARPFPIKNCKPEWASQLIAPLGAAKCKYESCVETDPIQLDTIYETTDGKPWKRGEGMPSYDQVFQGF